MPADLALFIIFTAALLVGVLRGGLRQLLAFGAWLVTFLLAAQMRSPFSEWIIGQAPQYSDAYAQMLAFLLVFLVLFGVALVLIEALGATIHLSRRPFVEELLGGLLLLGVAMLAVTSVLIILDTYYANPVPGAPEQNLVNAMHDALQQSAIASFLRESVAPVVLALLGPLLPADVRAGP